MGHTLTNPREQCSSADILKISRHYGSALRVTRLLDRNLSLECRPRKISASSASRRRLRSAMRHRQPPPRQPCVHRLPSQRRRRQIRRERVLPGTTRNCNVGKLLQMLKHTKNRAFNRTVLFGGDTQQNPEEIGR